MSLRSGLGMVSSGLGMVGSGLGMVSSGRTRPFWQGTPRFFEIWTLFFVVGRIGRDPAHDLRLAFLRRSRSTRPQLEPKFRSSDLLKLDLLGLKILLWGLKILLESRSPLKVGRRSVSGDLLLRREV